MSTYTVTYYPPGSTSPVAVSNIEAQEFLYTAEAVVFVDSSNAYVLAVPLALEPVVQRTAA